MNEPGPPSPLDFLYVCTANVCRSPAAEALHRRLMPGDTVNSAGTLATGEATTDDRTRAALRRRDADPGPRPSVPLTAELALGVDLVVAMTAAHALDVRALDDSLVERTFTLGELRSLLDREAPLRPAELAELRGTPPWTDRRRDDVADPYGQRWWAHRRLVTRLEADLQVLARARR